MAPTGVSLVVSLLTLALVAPAASGSPPDSCTGRLHGVLACGTTGHWHIEANVVRGERWTPDYVASPETTVSTKESSTTADPNQDQVTGVADLGALLDVGEGGIVTLVSGETRLMAHRAVLAATSPVFAAMIRHDTLEANTGEVAISDVEGAVLRQLVAYMYTGRAPQLPGMARPLLAAADKYGVDLLKDACEQQVVAQLDVENVAAAAVLSARHSCPTLREAAVDFIRGHTDEVMATQGWAEAVQRQPEDVAEFLRLLAKPPPDTSARATAANSAAAPTTASDATSAAASTTTPAAASATEHTTTSAASPQSTDRRQTPPPNATAVSLFRNLSAEEKGRRLREAAKAGAVEDVRALIAAGADVGAVDGYGLTALHWAAFRGRVGAARLLLEAGAAVDARSRWLQTPLHRAAGRGHAAVVRLLLAASADPDARGKDEWTPLHWAAWWGQTDAVAALLEGGADRWATDSNGQTALDFARMYNYQQVVDLLRANT